MHPGRIVRRTHFNMVCFPTEMRRFRSGGRLRLQWESAPWVFNAGLQVRVWCVGFSGYQLCATVRARTNAHMHNGIQVILIF